jgi:hypothetical protein
MVVFMIKYMGKCRTRTLLSLDKCAGVPEQDRQCTHSFSSCEEVRNFISNQGEYGNKIGAIAALWSFDSLSNNSIIRDLNDVYNNINDKNSEEHKSKAALTEPAWRIWTER